MRAILVDWLVEVHLKFKVSSYSWKSSITMANALFSGLCCHCDNALGLTAFPLDCAAHARDVVSDHECH